MATDSETNRGVVQLDPGRVDAPFGRGVRWTVLVEA
jgi:hypothetical protein